MWGEGIGHIRTIITAVDNYITGSICTKFLSPRFPKLPPACYYLGSVWTARHHITGSAVALHCYKAHAEINRKMGNSPPPCKIVTPGNIILKLCTRDYVGEIIRHANFGFNRYSGASPDFIWLSCPVLNFFSILPPGRIAGPIFTLYGSNDVFPRKDGLFGG